MLYAPPCYDAIIDDATPAIRCHTVVDTPLVLPRHADFDALDVTLLLPADAAIVIAAADASIAICFTRVAAVDTFFFISMPRHADAFAADGRRYAATMLLLRCHAYAPCHDSYYAFDFRHNHAVYLLMPLITLSPILPRRHAITRCH